MDTVSTTELSPAEKFYLSHKQSMKKYQQNNKEKLKQKTKEYLEKINSDPEKRKLYLEKKREYYYKVTKPKLDQIKLQEQDQNKSN